MAISQRLNLISTLWSLVRRAHHGPTAGAVTARGQLIERYSNAIRRYLSKVVRDRDTADEVFQEFAFHLAHGDLRGADPKRGRFRDFLKGTLFHLIAKQRKQRQRWPRSLPDEAGSAVAAPECCPAEAAFVDSWRDELLARAWAALATADAESGACFYAVLRFRADHPDIRSPQMAARLAVQVGRPLTAEAIRQLLHRARDRFADLLLDEVRQTLECPTAERLGQELVELGLLDYCRPALERQRHCQ